MNRKSRLFIKLFALLLTLGMVEAIYIHQTQSQTQEDIDKKSTFVSLTGLPDLAFANEASFVRHRSLSTIFDIYRDGENLSTYFPTASTYWHSGVINNTPSRVVK